MFPAPNFKRSPDFIFWAVVRFLWTKLMKNPGKTFFCHWFFDSFSASFKIRFRSDESYPDFVVSSRTLHFVRKMLNPVRILPSVDRLFGQTLKFNVWNNLIFDIRIENLFVSCWRMTNVTPMLMDHPGHSILGEMLKPVSRATVEGQVIPQNFKNQCWNNLSFDILIKIVFCFFQNYFLKPPHPLLSKSEEVNRSRKKKSPVNIWVHVRWWWLR